MAQLLFQDDGDIEYNDEGIATDTGYGYTMGWHKIEMVPDIGNDQFGAWYDGVT